MPKSPKAAAAGGAASSAGSSGASSNPPPAPPRSMQSATSQAFLMAILVSSLFSLSLNIYLSSRLSSLKDLQSLEESLKASFVQQRIGDAQVIKSAVEAHGEEVYHGDHDQQVLRQQQAAQKAKIVTDTTAKLPPPVKSNNIQQQPPPPLPLPPKKVIPAGGHQLAGLQCEKYGGPSAEVAQEMVYWEDIPSDNQFVSPFYQRAYKQYLSFEPDDGGWNNIRMNMETVLALAFAMGRTLVLPPEKEFYLLGKAKGEHGGEQKKTFSFSHFFHMESIHNEHIGLDIITMTEYLERVAMKGQMKSRYDQKVAFPPNNRTNWDGASGKELKVLYKYLRENSHMVVWVPEDCLAAFPASRSNKDEEALKKLVQRMKEEEGMPHWEKFVGKPVDVKAPTLDRLRENWATRKKLCVYNNIVQQQDSVHMPTDTSLNARLLVHFYAFLFFQDWRHDLWMKRFIRDHVRYLDEIQCAAARVVEAVRKRVRQRTPNNVAGDFDTFHVRRGDFQYKVTRISAEDMYTISKDKLTPGDTVYIATDERDKSFFDPLKEHYDVVFLDDFIDAMGKQVNTNYYGMVDQLVASRGRVFFGCWFSTFTAYINRLRGYHADDHQEPGYEQGIINSWYYALEDRYDHMQKYYPVKQAFYAREFPTSWRLIDTGIDALNNDH